MASMTNSTAPGSDFWIDHLDDDPDLGESFDLMLQVAKGLLNKARRLGPDSAEGRSCARRYNALLLIAGHVRDGLD